MVKNRRFVEVFCFLSTWNHLRSSVKGNSLRIAFLCRADSCRCVTGAVLCSLFLQSGRHLCACNKGVVFDLVTRNQASDFDQVVLNPFDASCTARSSGVGSWTTAQVRRRRSDGVDAARSTQVPSAPRPRLPRRLLLRNDGRVARNPSRCRVQVRLGLKTIWSSSTPSSRT